LHPAGLPRFARPLQAPGPAAPDAPSEGSCRSGSSGSPLRPEPAASRSIAPTLVSAARHPTHCRFPTMEPTTKMCLVSAGDVGLRRHRVIRRSRTTSVLRTRIRSAVRRTPRGLHDLRARVVDRAGNERSGTSRTNGQPAVLELPLRTRTTLQVGRPGRRVCHGRVPRAPWGAETETRKGLLCRPF